jgi:hypothetical protein
MSSASSNTKLDVRYKGTECSRYCVRSNWYGWLRFQNQILLRSFFIFLKVFPQRFTKETQRLTKYF